jgi:hypothetical protein
MRFARWVFVLAGLYGLIVSAALYVSERGLQPPLTHPEFYYGFAGLCLAWQLLFLLIGVDPRRMRPAMIPAIVEKLSFGIAIPILNAMGRIHATDMMVAAAIDLLLAALFVAAFFRINPNKGKELLFDRR